MTRYDLRTLFAAPKLWLPGCAVALALVAGPVAAQVTDPAFDRFRSQVVGNSVNFSYGGTGTPLAGAGNTTGIGVTSGVDVSRGATINTKHGPIAGTLRQKISSSAMGKAVGRVASAGGLATPLGLAFLAAPFVIDWFTGAGLDIEDGQVMQPEREKGGYFDGFEYAPNGNGPWSHDYETACALRIAQQQAAAPHESYSGMTGFTAPNTCRVTRTSEQGAVFPNSGLPISTRFQTSTPPPLGTEPATPASIEAALSVDFGPSPGALSELYKLAGTLDLAHPIPDLVDVLRAEWEARSPESVTETTSSTPTEDKTEQKKCATYTQWVGQTLSLVEQCATTTTTQAKDPETGAPVGDPKVSTSTTTDTTPDAKAKEGEEAEGLCKLFPKIAACATLDTPDGEVPELERTITYSAENLGLGGGSCPAPFTWTDSLGNHQLDLAPWCDKVEGVIRPLVLLMAMLAAFFIVAPVWSNQQ